MANEQNLKVIDSEKKARELGAKGGKASGESKRRKKLLKECLEILLEKDYLTKDGKITGAEAISTKLIEQAMKGNVKAFTTIRDTIGQAPVQKIQTSQVDPEVAKEVEAMIEGESDTIPPKESE